MIRYVFQNMYILYCIDTCMYTGTHTSTYIHTYIIYLVTYMYMYSYTYMFILTYGHLAWHHITITYSLVL